ncbi:MAG TPA: DUF58 domain-containing protein [Candidatus Thermoplasmatota archaeon]|nr:DUF58 domain-containing protein [Candidatus Thermoplasmatota archaeon]
MSPPTGLTPFGRKVTLAAATLLLLGLAFGAFPYLLCALLLAGVAFAARGLRTPRLEARRRLSAEDARAGDTVGIDITVISSEPAGVTLHDRTPDPFLLMRGRNFAAAWLPAGASAPLRYALKTPRRGTYPLGPLRATAYDPLFLQAAKVADVGEAKDVTVHPRTPAAPRIRTSSAWGRAHLPGGDKALRGVLTNDFRELRPYERGDPLRQVNWKATARQSRAGELNLVVNDYEVEGKKAVWLFVDASPYTVGGTTSESAFDELASAALAVAGHYLDQGHRVGFTLYGSGPTRVVYPDAGDLQERRIAAVLAAAEPGEAGDDAANPDASGAASSPQRNAAGAVEATKGFLVREKPLVFAFTLAGRDPTLGAALVSARALATAGRRPANVVAVAPVLADEDTTLPGRLVALREKAQLKGLERRGVTVLRYSPRTAPLMAILAKGALR